MQPKQTSHVTKVVIGILVAVFTVGVLVIAFPIIALFIGLIFHGADGNKQATYMKTEFTKISLPAELEHISTDCRDVEFRQECYFTYKTTMSKATATDSMKQTFTNAGYLGGVSKSSSYEDKYSIGVFQNNSTSLYASAIYRSDSQLAPAQRTSDHASQVEIQMYKL